MLPTQLVCNNEAESSHGEPMPQSRVYGIYCFCTPHSNEVKCRHGTHRRVVRLYTVNHGFVGQFAIGSVVLGPIYYNYAFET